MIFEQSLLLQDKLEDLNTAERRSREKTQIENTHKQLLELSKQIRRISNQLNTIGNLLAEQARQELLYKIKIIYEKIQEFSDDFSENSDQARRLKPFLENHVSPCLEGVREKWANRLDDEIKSERDIYLLVKNLPDVRSNGTEIEVALHGLLSARDQPPSTEVQLQQYQVNVKKLKTQIGGIKGLTPAVQSFLQKMAEKSATMEDLTPEIYDWVREPTRAKHFAIRFPEGMN